MIDSTSSVISVAGRVAGDVVSLGIVLGTLAQILPPLAALMSILWIGFQFYNSEQFQAWRKKRKDK